MEIKNQKILIVGCGKLGVLVGDELRQKKIDYSVYGIRRTQVTNATFPMLSKDIFADNFNDFLCDLKPSLIIYSATPSSQDPAEYRAVYLDGLKLISNILTYNNLNTQLCFISSTRVFNGFQGSGYIDDDTEPCPNDLQGEVLAAAETFILENSYGRVFRLSGIYGQERQMMIRLAKDTERWKTTENKMTNRIFDIDAAKIISLVVDKLLDSKKTLVIPNVINVTDCHPVDFYTVLNFIRKKLNLDIINHPENLTNPGKKITSTFLREKLSYPFTFPTFESGYSNIIDTLDK